MRAGAHRETGPLTYAQVVAARAAREPRGEVLRSADGERWAAADLWARASAWAAGLAGTVAPGDLVATALPASPEAVALTTAVSALGAVEVPVGAGLAPAQLARVLGRARLLAGGHETVETYGRGLGDLALVRLDGPRPDLAATHPRASRFTPRETRATDPALAMPTSGTTGRSKLAVLPAGAPIGQARRVARAMAYGPGDVLLSYFGWAHINARNATVLPALISGSRVVFVPRFSASGFLDVVRSEGVTAFNFMGALCMMLLAQPPTERDRDHRLRAGYGGPAPAALVDAFARRFGVVLRQGYACTELGDVANTPIDELRAGAAGRIAEDYDVQIVDDTGMPVPDGEIGELRVRPRRPGLSVLEYLDDPEQTAAAWTDGWFRTRDRARLDDGWLWFEGRSGDVIRRRGLNIDPSRVEAALEDHPAVAQAVAVSAPSELTEDEVHALVVPHRPDAVTPGELWFFCRDRLPAPMLPRFVTLVETLPLNDNLKLDRARLRTTGVLDGTWDAARDLVPVETP